MNREEMDALAKQGGATHALWHPEGVIEYYMDGLTEISLVNEHRTTTRGRRWDPIIAAQYCRREL